MAGHAPQLKVSLAVARRAQVQSLDIAFAVNAEFDR
jgi:hypothetical protein